MINFPDFSATLTDALSHFLRVLVTDVPVELHGEDSPVLVTEPSGDGGEIDSPLDAVSREKMAEVVNPQMR
jgi:hypothetical protein